MRTSLVFHALAVASSVAGSHAAPSPGCSSGGAFVRDSVVNVTVGVDRYYLVYIPVNYAPEEPAPLVLSFHGGSRIAEQQLNLDNLTSKAFNRDYIVAYPNGIDVSASSSEQKLVLLLRAQGLIEQQLTENMVRGSRRDDGRHRLHGDRH